MQSIRPEIVFMLSPNLTQDVPFLISISKQLSISSPSLGCHLSSGPRVCVRRGSLEWITCI